ncbi:phage holin family protein [Tropicimonas sediminicola]|uniref:Putative Holin-X, holin superfamily III n=1 Tax=Tropicimonas sediminicola TaxID=1031541 RepID=A0A239KE79_9RHOB|nr:phage holin family protein [Tropicimonas sediminicola]SNT16012.1 Putative Holin-X, holin superfamily III [Tropicimonas sediminicola]
MSRITRNAAIAIRMEKLIARREVAAVGRQIGMTAAAGILGAVGLIMLNVAGYLALAARLEPWLAALIVAIVNLALAALLLLVARNVSADGDVEAAREVRDLALSDLEGEVVDAAAEVQGLANDLRTVARNPLSAAGLTALVPLLTLILKNLKK